MTNEFPIKKKVQVRRQTPDRKDLSGILRGLKSPYKRCFYQESSRRLETCFKYLTLSVLAK